MKREIRLRPAYDRRNSGYGMHGVDLCFFLIGDEGVIQFVVATNWMIPHVQKQIDNGGVDSEFPFSLHSPMGADLGYHAKVQQFDGQTHRPNCDFIEGDCYYDGSSLQAEAVLDILREEGSDGVWARMEKEYSDRFGKDQSK